MAVSRAKVDASQVESYARSLQLASQLIAEEGKDFEELWGEKWADAMRTTVPVSQEENNKDGVHLRDEIRQVEPGGITFGRAYWWYFLERGTVNMSPQPFVAPARKLIRTPARKDAADRAIKLLRRLF